MLVSRWPGQESDAEIAFITDLAAERANEKNSVKDLLQEPFSSGPVGYRAGAIRTKGRPSEDRHGPHLHFRAGTAILHPNRPWRNGIAEGRNVTARQQARTAVRSLTPFLRQIVNPPRRPPATDRFVLLQLTIRPCFVR